jgi:hypothetical protein
MIVVHLQDRSSSTHDASARIVTEQRRECRSRECTEESPMAKKAAKKAAKKPAGKKAGKKAKKR